ncbi:extradiol dioxygenase [Methyloprofundus sedimenti]|uniref:MEMO1 family protein AU255_01340 n=1 Tax=Methyloprofundus sedimenti TaxID=1420851 RepID=A0A1V8M4Y5_9GAMM|nr:AmmeMemoRadiSam system protein B [Methyloprofundus sedimenti]OQK16578.1 extradiol dioxygenase [Methyloprofundus sedimenti]
MNNIRQPAVAGLFYPDKPDILKSMISDYLHQVAPVNEAPQAIIVPHAGYIYSGEIAASAYARLQSRRNSIKRVVVLGPSHKVSFAGLALSHAEAFRTPIGDIPVDTEAIASIIHFPFVGYSDQAHLYEHSLEVQLPFLQMTLDAFKLLPIVVGDCPAEQIEQVLELFYGADDTLIVISSDLSHFHDYATAQRLDKETSEKIEHLDYQHLDYGSACGLAPVSGLMALAKKKSLQIATIDLRNSGDTAGDKSRVVGYGAYVIN